MSTHVKICGLTREADVALAMSEGARYLGFIVEAPSKRCLSVSQASALSSPAKGFAKIVAVTVNPDDTLLSAIIANMAPDYIQCHGDETPERVAEISRRFNVGTIKALGIASESDMKSSEEYGGVCDFILYDAKPPKGTDVRGGHGRSVDWGLIGRSPRPKTFALAGGLKPENVVDAIRQTGAPIVDVSSGVESAAGVKDALKIKAFMDAVKKA